MHPSDQEELASRAERIPQLRGHITWLRWVRAILAMGTVLCWLAGLWMAAPYLGGLTGLTHPWHLVLGFAAGWFVSLPLQGARRRLGLRLEAARIFLAAERNVARSRGL